MRTLTFCGLLALVAADRHQSLRSGRRAASQRLRHESANLARALRQSVAGEQLPPPELLALARQRLAQAASGLPDAEGASLMKNYAEQAPGEMLVFSPEGLANGMAMPVMIAGPEDGPQGPQGPQDAMPQGMPQGMMVEAMPQGMVVEQAEPEQQAQTVSSESESQSIEQDSQGRTIRRMKRCQDGNCMEEVEVIEARQPVEKPAQKPVQMMVPEEKPKVQQSQAPANPDAPMKLSDAVKSMARSMHNVEASLGRDGLQDMLRQMFERERQEEELAHQQAQELARQAHSAPKALSANVLKADRKAESKAAEKAKRLAEFKAFHGDQRKAAEHNAEIMAKRAESKAAERAKRLAEFKAFDGDQRKAAEHNAEIMAKRAERKAKHEAEVEAETKDQHVRKVEHKKEAAKHHEEAPPKSAKHHEEVEAKVDSVSSVAEVVVDNGRVIRRTKKCHNGVCETAVSEGKVSEPKEKASEPKAHVMPL